MNDRQPVALSVTVAHELYAGYWNTVWDLPDVKRNAIYREV